MIYEGWEWEKIGDILKADCSHRQCRRHEEVEVGGHGQDHRARRVRVRSGHRRCDVSKAKRLTIDFEDDDDDSIEFQIPRVGEALGALKFCEENKK